MVDNIEGLGEVGIVNLVATILGVLMKFCSLFFAVFVVLFGQLHIANADFVISFTNGNDFEGHDGASGDGGDEAGPFVDSVSGVSTTLTTSVVAPIGESSLNPNSGTLGISSDSGNNAAFDDGEFWTFSFDKNVSFQGIDFVAFSETTETFTVQSAAFAGLTIDPGDSNITFSGDTFTFESADTSDDFNVDDIFGGDIVEIASGTGITIAFQSTATDFAQVGSLTFAAASVPEPAHLSLAAFGVLGWMYKRRRKKLIKEKAA